MADDRPVDDPVTELAKLRADLNDLRSTLMARTARLPTGSIEATILPTPRPDTLFLQGQIVKRADYPGLWQWVVDNDLLTVGLFGPADGSTTFGVPNFQGKILRGVAPGEIAGALVGSDSLVLTIAQMPRHTHNVSVDNAGQHGGHVGATAGTNVGAGSFIVDADDDLDDGGDHFHDVNEDAVGNGAPIDNRQASVAVNWAIWT